MYFRIIPFHLVDVHLVAELAQSSMDLLNRGLNFESFAPEYLYTHLSVLRVEMLAAATEDARQRAEQILKGAGSQRLRYVRYQHH